MTYLKIINTLVSYTLLSYTGVLISLSMTLNFENTHKRFPIPYTCTLLIFFHPSLSNFKHHFSTYIFVSDTRIIQGIYKYFAIRRIYSRMFVDTKNKQDIIWSTTGNAPITYKEKSRNTSVARERIPLFRDKMLVSRYTLIIG